MTDINTYFKNNKQRFLDELLEILKIPSVSADPNYAGDVAKMATTASKSPNPKWQRVGGALNRFLAERMPD